MTSCDDDKVSAADSVLNRHAGPKTRKRPLQTHFHEPATERHAKRQQQEPAPSTTFLGMAKQCMEAERLFYEANDSDYSPLISDERKVSGVVPTLDHLLAAANEFARRFPFRTVEDEELFADSEATSSESPFLLVANNVKDGWHVPDDFLDSEHPPVRFMLVPGDTENSSILFIQCMTGPEHGQFDGAFTRDIDNWITANDLSSVLIRVDAGGKSYIPDKAYKPYTPDRLAPRLDSDKRLNGAPYARLIVEVEYAHRTGRALRMTGFQALNNNYTRLFLCVRLWKKNGNSHFSAAAVLWAKNDAGTLSVVKAVDFGTRGLNASAKRGFQVQGDNMLPPVTAWTRPIPHPSRDELRSMPRRWTSQMETNENWSIALPKVDLLYKVSTDDSTDLMPYLLDDPTWPIPDCCIYLRRFARDMNKLTF